MSDESFQSASSLNFGVITFGGLNVPSGHYLRVNGKVTDVTTDGLINTELVGYSFIVGVPMRLFRLTYDASIGGATLHILKNGASNDIIIANRRAVHELGPTFLLDVGDVLRLRVTHGRAANDRYLVSLYFFALPENVQRMFLPAVNILTFNGYSSRAGERRLRFNGDIGSATDDNDQRNSCIVGAPMIINRLTWLKTSDRNLNNITITLSGTAPAASFNAAGAGGVLDVTPYPVNTGDVLRVNCTTSAGSCLISLYAIQI